MIIQKIHTRNQLKIFMQKSLQKSTKQFTPKSPKTLPKPSSKMYIPRFFSVKKTQIGTILVKDWQLQQQERRENYKKSFIVLSVMLTILPGSSKCHFPSRLAHPVVSFYAGLYASFTLLTPNCYKTRSKIFLSVSTALKIFKKHIIEKKRTKWSNSFYAGFYESFTLFTPKFSL